MVGKNKDLLCCASDTKETSCKVESLITVDERGQMVLPRSFAKGRKSALGTSWPLLVGIRTERFAASRSLRRMPWQSALRNFSAPCLRA